MNLSNVSAKRWRMERYVGNTGLAVSRIGLGLAALGRPGYINLGHADDLGSEYDPAAMETRTHAVLDEAWASGIRYFDVARSYGRAEEFLGTWLRARGIPPGVVAVGSKWGYRYTAGWRVDAKVHEVKEHSLDVLRRQFAESRERLGDHLDLYQIHSATLDSGVLERSEVLDELGRLREEGLLVGATVSGPKQAETLRRALEVSIGGRRLFDAFQVTWNLLERSAEEVLSEAHAGGVGVIVKEGVANGRLTARNTEPSFARKRRLLDEIVSSTGASVDAVALAAILARPWADVVLSGASSIEQLRSNLTALEVTLDRRAHDRLAELAEPREAYWDARGRLAWN